MRARFKQDQKIICPLITVQLSSEVRSHVVRWDVTLPLCSIVHVKYTMKTAVTFRRSINLKNHTTLSFLLATLIKCVAHRSINWLSVSNASHPGGALSPSCLMLQKQQAGSWPVDLYGLQKLTSWLQVQVLILQKGPFQKDIVGFCSNYACINV